jgi:hypothetical protein
VVIATPSPHNVIIRRPGLKTLGAIVSTPHGMVCFPTPRGVATIKSDVEKQIAMVEKPVMMGDDLKVVQDDILVNSKWIINHKFPDQVIEIGQKLQGK